MAEVKISKEMSVNQIIKLYPKSIGVFNRFNIDSCCGGAETLEKAVKNAGANLDEVLNEIKKAVEE
jgi:regulator of cell morphogenesis and NO signaling